jgi:hypothetical protein
VSQGAGRVDVSFPDDSIGGCDVRESSQDEEAKIEALRGAYAELGEILERVAAARDGIAEQLGYSEITRRRSA